MEGLMNSGYPQRNPSTHLSQWWLVTNVGKYYLPLPNGTNQVETQCLGSTVIKLLCVFSQSIKQLAQQRNTNKEQGEQNSVKTWKLIQNKALTPPSPSLNLFHGTVVTSWLHFIRSSQLKTIWNFLHPRNCPRRIQNNPKVLVVSILEVL